MAKPACECTDPRWWVIAYLSSSPTDKEPIAIEIRCSKHHVNWWWKIEQPVQEKEETTV